MYLRLALALSLLAARPQNDVEVTLQDNRVVVRTLRAPLADVLSRFAQATGTEVVYESARPRQLVSVVIESDSAAGAIAQLLEGQGLNYVLRLDPTGKKVEMLVITGSTSPSAASAGTARPGAGPPVLRPPEEDSEVEPGEADPPFAAEVDESPEPPAPPAPSPAEPQTQTPAMGSPWPGPTPGAAPGMSLSPGLTSPSTISGSPAPEPGQPQVPGAASYPGNVPMSPPVAQPPVFPGPASY
jgi:hypothetical protein